VILVLAAMKPYSIDLRQKIVDTYLEGGISQRQLAARFRVTLSFIEKLLKQYRETGELAPKTRTYQTPRKLSDEQLNALKELAQANQDATLAQLRQQLYDTTGILLGRSTVARMLQTLDLNKRKLKQNKKT